MLSVTQQTINLFAALLLLLSFAMLTQTRMLNLIRLLVMQGLVLTVEVGLVAFKTGHAELFVTMLLTLLLKVWLIPFILYRLLKHLGSHSITETMINMPTTLLLGLGLVIFAFNLSLPMTAIATAANPHTLALALASVFISSLMMIIKRKAISQVIGLLALENSLFFAATSATDGMPLIVELGIAFDVLIGLFIFGIFFFQLRDTFDSLDIHHLEHLKDE